MLYDMNRKTLIITIEIISIIILFVTMLCLAAVTSINAQVSNSNRTERKDNAIICNSTDDIRRAFDHGGEYIMYGTIIADDPVTDPSFKNESFLYLEKTVETVENYYDVDSKVNGRNRHIPDIRMYNDWVTCRRDVQQCTTFNFSGITFTMDKLQFEAKELLVSNKDAGNRIKYLGLKNMTEGVLYLDISKKGEIRTSILYVEDDEVESGDSKFENMKVNRKLSNTFVTIIVFSMVSIISAGYFLDKYNYN